MKDIQQLIKKNSQEGRYEDIFPKTFIDAVEDRESGNNLTEILSGFNMYFLSYNGSRELTRLQVPLSIRKTGLWITYVLYDKTVVTEWYAGEAIDDDSWKNLSNWRVGSNMLVGDISISSDGYWVVNGVITTTKAQGEQGITPMLRVGSNNHLQVSYTNGSSWIDVSTNPVYTQFRVLNNKLQQSIDLGNTYTYISEELAYKFQESGNKLQMSKDLGNTWEDVSDYIAAWFKFTGTTGSSQADNVGKIQISRDNGATWSDLSGEFTNSLYIKGYVATVGALPSSAVQGDIYGVGPTYDPSDTGQTNPIYQLYVKDSTGWVNNGKFTSIAAGVVQTTGTSTTEVMSQDAVSKEFASVRSEMNGILNNSFNYCELEKLPLFFIQGTFIEATGVVYPSTTAVTTEIASLINIDILYLKIKDGCSVKTIQFNNSSKIAATDWGIRYELETIGDSIRIAIKNNDGTDISVADVIRGGLLEVYVKKQQSVVKTSKELTNLLNVSDVNGTILLPEFRQGSLTAKGALYYSTDAIHFKDFIEVVPYTTYYIKLNEGFQYKVLRSSDGININGESNWSRNNTYTPLESKYLKFVISVPISSVITPFDAYKAGLVISRTPFVIATRQAITDYISAESLQKSVLTPKLENYTYYGGFIASDARLSIRNLIEVNTFFEYNIQSALTNLTVTHIYFDKDKNYIKSLQYRPINEKVRVDKNVRYVSLVISKLDDSNISPSGVSLSFTAWTANNNTEIVKTYSHKKHAQKYYGEKINLGHDFDRDIFIETILQKGDNNKNIVKQANLYNGGLYYQFYNLGYCAIYNTETKLLVRQFYLNGEGAIEGLHCNSATLVKEDANGIYVCLSSFNSSIGYVYYITSSSCSLIQTINITVNNHDGSNVFVDKLNKKLYIMYKKTGDTNKLYINEYSLPSLTDDVVNLDSADIIESYEIDYCIMQDLFINGNKLYLLYGVEGQPIGINVYSLSDFVISSQIDLSCWNTEPEGITQYGNGILLNYYSNNTLFLLTFD